MAAKEKETVEDGMVFRGGTGPVLCKNCQQPLKVGENGVIHEHMLRRCKPWHSGQPYGLEAELPDDV